MKLTNESIAKDNKKCSNEWRINVQGSLIDGSKQLSKIETLDEKQHIEYTMYHNHKKEVQIRRSVWTSSGTCGMCSSGLGKVKVVSDPQPRKLFKNLVSCTSTFTYNVLEDLFNGVEDWNPGGVLI